MTTQDTVQALRKEASTNNLFKAICLVFAARERARNQVTMEALTAKLKKEGWAITYEEAAKALNFLASMGIGTPVYKTKNGKKVLVSIVDIKLKLQDVGRVALGQGEKIAKFRPSTRYTPLVAPPAATEPNKEEPKVIAIKERAPLEVHVTVGGQDIMFPINIDSRVAPEQLGNLLMSLHKTLSQLEA